MAIAKKSLKKLNESGTADGAPIGGTNSALQDEPLLTLSDQGELAISHPPPLPLSHLFRKPFQWLRKNAGEEVVTAVMEEPPQTMQEPSHARPSDLEKTGFVS